jgi:hypothetical protein
LSQEQIVPMMHVDPSKWEDLAANLCEVEGADYLIDDVTASGTTFMRTWPCASRSAALA